MTGQLALLDTAQVTIPATDDEYRAAVDGTVALHVAKGWALAALVASRVDVQEGPGRADIVNIGNKGLLSTTQYAARGYRGLDSPTTVRRYARLWLDRYPRPVPGETVALPDTDLPKAAPQISSNSGAFECYTPAPIIDAARRALGDIDLDPASSDDAQAVVGADRYYTQADDGLAQPWRGRVWMNPPWQRGVVDQFVNKLCDEHQSGAVTAALSLTHNATETKWGARLLRASSAVCFPTGRIDFTRSSGGAGALQGQMIAYLGDDHASFADAFAGWGVVLRVQ